MMKELCQVLSKIHLKNVKMMASVTTLSLLLSSIIVFLITFSYQFAITYSDNPVIVALLVAGEITLLFCLTDTDIATALMAAASHAGTKLSPHDLISALKSERQTPFRRWRNPFYFLVIMALRPPMFRQKRTIAASVIETALAMISVWSLYAWVVPDLAVVILVVEDGCEAAAKRGEKLLEGQKVHGFMAMLAAYVMLIAGFGFWMIVGDRGEAFDVTLYGLFFINSAFLTRIFLALLFTVYYFRCKEYHNHQLQACSRIRSYRPLAIA